MRSNEKKEEDSSPVPKVRRYASSHSMDLIIGDPEQHVKTRSSINLFNNLAFFFFLKFNQKVNVKNNEFWILIMQPELN